MRIYAILHPHALLRVRSTVLAGAAVAALVAFLHPSSPHASCHTMLPRFFARNCELLFDRNAHVGIGGINPKLGKYILGHIVITFVIFVSYVPRLTHLFKICPCEEYLSELAYFAL